MFEGLTFYMCLATGIAILGEVAIWYAKSETKIKSRAKVIKCPKKKES